MWLCDLCGWWGTSATHACYTTDGYKPKHIGELHRITLVQKSECDCLASVAAHQDDCASLSATAEPYPSTDNPRRDNDG